MKKKHYILLGLAAVGGYVLWKKVGGSPATDPLYAEYLVWRDGMDKQHGQGKYAIPGQSQSMLYIMDFEMWKKSRATQGQSASAILAANARTIQGLLQNGTIVAGVGDPLPPNPMEMAWDYPGLQSSHAPGRIFKV